MDILDNVRDMWDNGKEIGNHCILLGYIYICVYKPSAGLLSEEWIMFYVRIFHKTPKLDSGPKAML